MEGGGGVSGRRSRRRSTRRRDQVAVVAGRGVRSIIPTGMLKDLREGDTESE